MNRRLQFTVLIFAGIVFGLVIYQALMWAVLGAPTHPIQYIALTSAIGLLLSAFAALTFPQVGRWLSIVCCLGIGVYFIPMAQTLVPNAAGIVSPFAFLLIVGYFALLRFCLFYPSRKVISYPVFVLSLLIAFGFWSYTLSDRITDGEYNRPAIASFEWKPSDEALHFTDGRGSNWLSENMLSTLISQGIEGSLDWQGSSGWDNRSSKMIIVSSGPIPEDKHLHYPKDSYVIYVFDGMGWRTIPQDVQCYPSFATLTKDGMLFQGPQGTSAFRW